MRFAKSILAALFLAIFFSTISSAAVPDRITARIDSSQMVALKGNTHRLAQSRFDLGRADSGKLLHGVTLEFRPSAAQQLDLNNLLAQQQDRSSTNYHKWLKPAQFADRFGMTQADIERIKAWLQSQGFAVTSVANSRNEISFEGTVSQIEAAFQTEIHYYLVDGVVHIANAANPAVPAALAGSVLALRHLHDFAPRPREKARPHLTSYVTGLHFVTPGDFATVYDVAPLYAAGSDGTGQKIAIAGQSSVSATDLSNFRSASGLSANAPQMVLLPGTTSTRCPGDEGESDLDLEWSGGVAKNATIIFVYAGLITANGDSCAGNRSFDVWDALNYAVQNKVAPFVSTSYGYCESGLGQSFVDTVQGWVQQANSQGQTVVAASGDSGAADCDPDSTDPNDTSATGGLAVDVPAAIPEVTGMGGNTFNGDAAGTVTGTGANTNAAATTYWSGTTNSTDAISSALSYIPEVAWNDTTADLAVVGGSISASGGGASIFFAKPSWQTGTGVPADGNRDVPDLSLAASPNHDGYLICSEDGTGGAIQSSCTAGFRTGPGGDFTVVGGTSVSAPSFAAILALINESLGNTPPSGLGNVNPNLYSFAASNASAFHDVTSGNNVVPCTSGTPNCPAAAPFQYGFSAGTGYDQVTGLGSVDVDKLALAWAATETSSFTLTPTAASFTVSQGASANATVNVAFATGFAGTVTFTCTDPAPGSICNLPPQINAAGQVSFNITTTAPTVGSLRPSDRGTRIFYAALLPGLLGIMFTAGSRRRSLRGIRFLGLIVFLGFSTLWLASCGGSSNTNATGGTTKGNYTITVSASSPGVPTQTATFQIVVQ